MSVWYENERITHTGKGGVADFGGWRGFLDVIAACRRGVLAVDGLRRLLGGSGASGASVIGMLAAEREAERVVIC